MTTVVEIDLLAGERITSVKTTKMVATYAIMEGLCMDADGNELASTNNEEIALADYTAGDAKMITYGNFRDDCMATCTDSSDPYLGCTSWEITLVGGDLKCYNHTSPVSTDMVERTEQTKLLETDQTCSDSIELGTTWNTPQCAEMTGYENMALGQCTNGGNKFHYTQTGYQD